MAHDSDTTETKPAAGEAFEHFEHSPIALVLGGIAVGAIIGALLPRLAREKELLAPIGKRIADTAGAAAKAAREKGKEELSALLPDRGETKDKVTQFVGNVIDAAKQAAAKPKS